MWIITSWREKRRSRRDDNDDQDVYACIANGPVYLGDIFRRTRIKDEYRVHVALVRLGERGLIDTGLVDQPAGPPRRYYVLTQATQPQEG